MSRVPCVLALGVAAVLAGSAAAAGSAFRGDVCSLLGARQATTISGVSSHCTRAKPLSGLGATIYGGNWSGNGARSPQLQVTVSVYTDPGALQLAKRNLDQGLPGAPKKAAGIGSAAYEASGASSTAVRFAVGKDIVFVVVNAIRKPSPSTASVEALAKDVAAKLT